MDFTYGNGTYLEGTKRIEGRIILGEHKLFLRGEKGDYTQTYIPLEKIFLLKKVSGGIELHVTPTISFQFTAVIRGDKQSIKDLSNELVLRRGLKKRFLRNEWYEQPG